MSSGVSFQTVPGFDESEPNSKAANAQTGGLHGKTSSHTQANHEQHPVVLLDTGTNPASKGIKNSITQPPAHKRGPTVMGSVLKTLEKSTEHEDTDTYNGNPVVTVQKLCEQHAETAQDIESRRVATGETERLQKQLSERQAEAEQYERLTEQARIKTIAVRNELELAYVQEATVLAAKRKLEELDHEIQEARKKLQID